MQQGTELDSLFQWLVGLVMPFLSMESRMAALYLAATAVLVYGIWRLRGRRERFLAFALPKSVYFHRSNWLDIKIFVVNATLTISGVMAALVFTPLVVSVVLTLLSAGASGDTQQAVQGWEWQLIATLVMVLSMDFCKYWAHYIHHEWRALWPFHAVHHSAEVLTPLTAGRNHPVFLIIRSVIYSLVLGCVQAVMLFLFVGQVDLLTIGGANAGYVLFNLVGSNLRHSHVWLSYGPVLEHVFISPAQHQIHHSRAVRHHNKNYGEIFAFWDWM
ncbi:MAG: sterol desaturase family protein, partial [Pseudomonadota bacterium]